MHGRQKDPRLNCEHIREALCEQTNGGHVSAYVREVRSLGR